MKGIILYKSKYGATKQYAEWIAEDLGCEALRELYVEDMPLTVIIDSEGNNLYESGRTDYRLSKKAPTAEK